MLIQGTLLQDNLMLTLPKRWRHPWQARSAVANQLRSRYFLRVHAFLLFVWTFGLSWLVAKFLLLMGPAALWQRYAITCVVGYLLFLLGMRIWLSYVGAIRDTLGQLDGADLQLPSGSGGGNPSLSGGGGSFDGGGASGNFDLADGVLDKAGSGGGKLIDGIGDAVDGDGCLPILVIGLVLFLLALLFILFGPELLIEVAFEAVLAGSLVSAVRLGRRPDWMLVVVKKTAWLFVIVLCAMVWFGKYAEKHYPQAQSVRQLLQLMSAPDPSRNKP